MHGDALSELARLPAGIAQTCVTSPPYYGLRSYGTEPIVWPAVSYAPMPGLPELDVPAWRGNLGLEPTPEMFVAHLVAIFREVRRVLRDDGVCWLNMGDSYSTHAAGDVADPMAKSTLAGVKTQEVANRDSRATGRYFKYKALPEKNLMMIPARVALALQADGWWLRSDVIWRKGNPVPESVTDRPTKSHEHIFLLAKSDRYFYDAEAVKEPVAEATIEREQYGYNHAFANQFRGSPTDKRHPNGKELGPGLSGQTRNKRDVWDVNTVPFKAAHFAVFPPELPDTCIRAGTSERGQCPHCGAPWERIVEKSTEFHGGSGRAGRTAEDVNANGKWAGKQYGTNIKLGPVNSTQTVGWRPTCGCPEHEPVPQLVIDPFSGAGTTGLVATRLGRRYIGIEPNAEYVQMAAHRIIDDAPLFNAAAQVDAEEVTL